MFNSKPQGMITYRMRQIIWKTMIKVGGTLTIYETINNLLK